MPRSSAWPGHSLTLHGATYDELFENLSHSSVAAELKSFWRQYGEYRGRSKP